MHEYVVEYAYGPWDSQWKEMPYRGKAARFATLAEAQDVVETMRVTVIDQHQYSWRIVKVTKEVVG